MTRILLADIDDTDKLAGALGGSVRESMYYVLTLSSDHAILLNLILLSNFIPSTLKYASGVDSLWGRGCVSQYAHSS